MAGGLEKSLIKIPSLTTQIHIYILEMPLYYRKIYVAQGGI